MIRPQYNRYAEALTVSGQFEEALQVYGEYSDSLLSSDQTRILDSLHSIISHVRENVTSLETILALFTKAGETTHTTEVYELLAHAYVQSGELEKARDFYLKLDATRTSESVACTQLSTDRWKSWRIDSALHQR